MDERWRFWRPGDPERIPIWQQPAFVYLLLFALASLPYANTLLNDFVYDDDLQILENPAIQNFHRLSQITTDVWRFAAAAGVHAKYFRPVMTLTYLALHKVYGNLPMGFHIVNILLAGSVACLIYGVTLLWTSSKPVACIAAALFALHPVHSEIVAWVAGMGDLEATLFLLIAFFVFVDMPHGGPPSLRRSLFMGTAFGLAILSKETAAGFPILACFFEHLCRAQEKETPFIVKLQRYAPFWIALGGYLGLRWSLLGGIHTSVTPGALPAATVALTGFALLAKYIGKLLWPAHLLAYYVFPPRTQLFDPLVLAGIFFFIASVCFVVMLRRRQPVAAFGLLWFLVFLAPALNIRWLASAAFAERYLFLPSVGFVWCAAALAVEFWRRAQSRNRGAETSARTMWIAGRYALVCVTAALGLACVLRIRTRNHDWRDDQVFYETILRDEPRASLIRVNLGALYANQGKQGQARAEWLRVAQESPKFSDAWTDLAMMAIDDNDLASAQEYLQHALQASVTSSYFYQHARLRQKQGQMLEAEVDLRHVVELSPLNSTAHLNLARIALSRGSRDEAASEADAASEGATAPETWCGVGDLYLELGRMSAAERAYRSALAMNPFHPFAHGGLGFIYEQRGERDKARAEYEAALVMDPRDSRMLEGLRRVTTPTF
jgi:protein O-mannosyl-transferase